jgi:hypothetical protein
VLTAVNSAPPPPETKSYITPTQHERDEWLRLGQAAHAAGNRMVWLTYTAASVNGCKPMPVDQFDTLQARYRDWLLTGDLSL